MCSLVINRLVSLVDGNSGTSYYYFRGTKEQTPNFGVSGDQNIIICQFAKHLFDFGGTIEQIYFPKSTLFKNSLIDTIAVSQTV